MCVHVVIPFILTLKLLQFTPFAIFRWRGRRASVSIRANSRHPCDLASQQARGESQSEPLLFWGWSEFDYAQDCLFLPEGSGVLETDREFYPFTNDTGPKSIAYIFLNAPLFSRKSEKRWIRRHFKPFYSTT